MAAAQPVSPRVAYVLMTLTALFWAGNFVVGRAAAGNIPPLTLAWVRWTGAALIILPFAARQLWDDRALIRKQALFLFGLGVMGAGIFNTLQYIALTMMTAVTGSVLNSAGPIFIAIACWIILGDRLRAWQIAGIALSLAGVLVVVMRGDLSALPPLGQSLGELITFFGLAVWAVYTALLRYRPQVHPLSFAAITYFVAALVNTPAMIWELASGASVTLDLSTLAAFAYVATFPSLLAYMFFNAGVESIGGARASAFIHLAPLFTALLAIVFLGETFALYHLIGFLLIVSGVYLTAAMRS